MMTRLIDGGGRAGELHNPVPFNVQEAKNAVRRLAQELRDKIRPQAPDIRGIYDSNISVPIKLRLLTKIRRSSEDNNLEHFWAQYPQPDWSETREDALKRLSQFRDMWFSAGGDWNYSIEDLVAAGGLDNPILEQGAILLLAQHIESMHNDMKDFIDFLCDDNSPEWSPLFFRRVMAGIEFTLELPYNHDKSAPKWVKVLGGTVFLLLDGSNKVLIAR